MVRKRYDSRYVVLLASEFRIATHARQDFIACDLPVASALLILPSDVSANFIQISFHTE